MMLMSIRRLTIGVLASFIVCLFLLFYRESLKVESAAAAPQPSTTARPKAKINPLYEEFDEPEGLLRRVDDPRVNATFVTLCRDKDMNAILSSIKQVESTFNSKFHYPWTFFNDQEFSQLFKSIVSREVSGPVEFVKIHEEDWQEPPWINRTLAQHEGKLLKTQEHVQHADETSYKRMCRWFSGKFFDHPALSPYQYYWRVEPNTQYFCSIDYDVFAYLADNSKDYGFVMSVYDAPQSVRSLWPVAQEFFAANPQFVHPNNAQAFLVQDSRPWHLEMANGYSTCHFWSNFEIASLDFWRSPGYRQFFDAVDKHGLFFYERAGDAPVHTIALAMMLDRDRIHYFRDIGYRHDPYTHCPTSNKCGGCTPGRFASAQFQYRENCVREWFKVADPMLSY